MTFRQPVLFHIENKNPLRAYEQLTFSCSFPGRKRTWTLDRLFRKNKSPEKKGKDFKIHDTPMGRDQSRIRKKNLSGLEKVVGLMRNGISL